MEGVLSMFLITINEDEDFPIDPREFIVADKVGIKKFLTDAANYEISSIVPSDVKDISIWTFEMFRIELAEDVDSVSSQIVNGENGFDSHEQYRDIMDALIANAIDNTRYQDENPAEVDITSVVARVLNKADITDYEYQHLKDFLETASDRVCQ
jgi:hypothetical protein